MSEIDTQIILNTLGTNSLEFAGIFGSRARGNASVNSDLDLLVRFKEPQGLLRLSALRRQLSHELGVEVDLVTEGALSPYIRENVMKDLKTIYGAR
ncbi:MAG TPA: nucleotidyltransferase family protein [Candidatus Paceibacterota bacterium]